MKRTARSCTYAVDVSDGEIVSVARYLSTLSLAGCEVVIFDNCSEESAEGRRRVLRWVGRYVGGTADVIHAATELASCEKVFVANSDTRYTAAEIGSICKLLESHEVVEPEEYVDPLSWWSGIDAGRLLIHRGVDQVPKSHSTFAFRRSAFRAMFGLEGAHVQKAKSIFVRREPPPFSNWLKLRPRESSDLWFLGFLPLMFVLAMFGGLQMVASGAGMIAFASIMLAVRGRIGASRFFPLHACLYAPLWIAERSVTAYWTLFDRLRRAVPAARLKPVSVGVTTPRETNGSASTIA